jgi:hypothetical protein
LREEWSNREGLGQSRMDLPETEDVRHQRVHSTRSRFIRSGPTPEVTRRASVPPVLLQNNIHDFQLS